jgi:polysaccharide export outer membrane protein
MRLILFFAVGVLFFLNACVPNRKYVYLQKNDLYEAVSTDTMIRSYSVNIEEYKIQPLDILSIRIESLTEEEFDFMAKLNPQEQNDMGGSNQNNLLRGYLVDESGNIEFPVVGKVKIGGLSVFEAQDSLKHKFKIFLKDPVPRVRLMNFRFTVLGEVKREGQVISANTRITLMEAIGLSGGLGELADRSKVKIIRQQGERAEVFYMNLLDEDILQSKNFYVQQNDIIMVSALKQRPFRIYWTENLSLLVSTLTLVLLVVNLTQ